MLSVLRQALGGRDVLVRIGSENDEVALRSLAVVAAGYGLPQRQLGTVSVIGPLRMDYGRVIRSVREAAASSRASSPTSTTSADDVPRDYYEVLGVVPGARTTRRSRRRSASWRASCIRTSTATIPQAEEKFKEAAEAYEVLSDSQRRATYDRYGQDGLRSGGYAPNFEGFGSVADIFEAFFGGGFGGAFGAGARAAGPAQGGDVSLAAEIDLATAARGTSLEVAYEAVVLCEHCHGNAAEPGTPIETCPRCGGTGQLRAVSRTPFGQVVRATACDVCGGDGRVATNPCAVCDGRGRRVEHVKLIGRRSRRDRHRPADPRRRPRPRRRARRPARRPVRPDRRPRGPAVHARRRRSATPPSTSPRRWPRSARRSRCRRSRARSSSRSRPGTQPNETIVLKGRGMPSLRGRRPGDLRVVVNVVIPRHLKREQRELLVKLADSLTEENLRADEGVFGKLKRAFGG